MHSNNDVRHAPVVERIRRVVNRVVHTVPVERRIADHDGRKALVPVVQVVREIDARNERRRVDRVDRERRRRRHRPLDRSHEVAPSNPSDHRDEVARARIEHPECSDRVPLTVWSIREIPDHLEPDHYANLGTLLRQ